MQQQVPFPFKDRFELWLLDADARPLALIHSVIDARDMRCDLGTEWRAGLAAAERFASPVMSEIQSNLRAGDYLTRHVNERAGPAPMAQWFQREADASGAGLSGIRLPESLSGRRLPAENFPPLFLADADDSPHQRLIADFHAWQAAWLLVLPHLPPPLRRQLEQQAQRQAEIVEGQFRLYPEILDAAVIQAARVEAILRRDAPIGEAKNDETLSTFYIELSQNPRK